MLPAALCQSTVHLSPHFWSYVHKTQICLWLSLFKILSFSLPASTEHPPPTPFQSLLHFIYYSVWLPMWKSESNFCGIALLCPPVGGIQGLNSGRRVYTISVCTHEGHLTSTPASPRSSGKQTPSKTGNADLLKDTVGEVGRER